MELEERNQRPTETSESLPKAVLAVLIGIVALLLYVGWQMVSDNPSNINELSALPVEEAPKKEEIQENQDSEVVENTEVETAIESPTKVSETFTSHTVASGETLFSIANRYNLKTTTIEKYNSGVDVNSLKVGSTVLKIPVQAMHTVGPGDILRVVGGKYNVSVDQLMKANAKEKNFAERGEILIIPYKDKQ